MPETKMTAEFITPDDGRWMDFLADVPHDIYHLPEYLQFTSKHEGGEPQAFYVETATYRCLVPLLRRDIPWQLNAPEGWCDITSPYGYASPLLSVDGDPSALQNSLSALKCLGEGTGIVSAFLRFNPLLPPSEDSLSRLSNLGDLVNHGQTVYIDLSLSNEEVWRQTRKNHRVGIHKLVREGFEVVINEFDYLYEFTDIYRKTMERVGSKELYLFSDLYFDDLLLALEGKMNLVCVLAPSGEIASGGLFSNYQDIIEFHLAGTNDKYLKYAPTKLMFDFVRRWGQDNSCKTFHLGGGVGASSDQLLHFKSGFSRLRGAFHTLRVVFDPEKYRKLTQKDPVDATSEPDGDDQYFPLYRKHFH